MSVGFIVVLPGFDSTPFVRLDRARAGKFPEHAAVGFTAVERRPFRRHGSPGGDRGGAPRAPPRYYPVRGGRGRNGSGQEAGAGPARPPPRRGGFSAETG